MKRQNEVWPLESDSEDFFDEGQPLVEAYSEVPARRKPSKRYPAFLLAVVLAISVLLSLFVSNWLSLYLSPLSLFV